MLAYLFYSKFRLKLTHRFFAIQAQTTSSFLRMIPVSVRIQFRKLYILFWQTIGFLISKDSCHTIYFIVISDMYQYLIIAEMHINM